MSKVLIPFALVNNKVKNISQIYKQDEVKCLECGERLILRNGDKNIKHLSHSSNSNCVYKTEYEYKKSGRESYEHKYAKEYIKDNLKYFRAYGNEVIIKDGEFKLGGFKDLKINKVDIEYRYLKRDLNLIKDYIPDILIRTDKALIALEIYKTHKKDIISLNNILKGKNIIVYEVDINSISVLDFKSIFKNMKLIYSDLKVSFDSAMSPIQNKIIECEKQANIIELKENFIFKQEQIINDLNEAINRLEKENDTLRDTFISDYEEIVSKNKILEYKCNELKDEYKRKDKEEYLPMRKFIMKYLYSNEMNEIIKNDMKKYKPTSNEFIILDKFFKSFNGKVGDFISWGGKEKVNKIKNTIKAYKENIIYLGINNDRFEQMVGLKVDRGEEILKAIINNDILDIVE